MIERWPDCNPELQVSKIKGKVFERLFKLKQNSKIQRWMAEKNSGSKAPGFLPQKKRIIIAAKEAQNKLQALCVSNAAPRSCWAVTQGCRELTDAQKWRVMGDGWQALSAVHTPRASAIPALLEVLAQDPETIWVVLGNVTTAGAVACAKSSHSSLNCLEGCSKW